MTNGTAEATRFSFGPLAVYPWLRSVSNPFTFSWMTGDGGTRTQFPGEVVTFIWIFVRAWHIFVTGFLLSAMSLSVFVTVTAFIATFTESLLSCFFLESISIAQLDSVLSWTSIAILSFRSEPSWLTGFILMFKVTFDLTLTLTSWVKGFLYTTDQFWSLVTSVLHQSWLSHCCFCVS